MWDDSITEASLYDATRDACIHKYISSLDGAYEYHLAEDGNNISKGQGQKIEISRAFIYNPSVVLFDEAARAIEPESRENIQKALLRRGCACIVVTHLLSQVTDYDEIIILDKRDNIPFVSARGKHEELMGSSPFYKTLFEAEKETVKI
jgi:ABC-type multidrug transport system fused ATPase/permease subunit